MPRPTLFMPRPLNIWSAISVLGLMLFSSGCVTHQAASPSGGVWSQYLRSSPFSYPQDDDGEMVAMLAREIRAIPVSGADPDIEAHVRSAADWASEYPIYLSKANDAYNRVYQMNRGYSGIYSNAGMMAGAFLSKSRGFAGTIGSFLGDFVNELNSRNEASKVRARVMKPSYDRALLLAMAEHRINARLGLASTNYLRRILHRY